MIVGYVDNPFLHGPTSATDTNHQQPALGRTHSGSSSGCPPLQYEVAAFVQTLLFCDCCCCWNRHRTETFLALVVIANRVVSVPDKDLVRRRCRRKEVVPCCLLFVVGCRSFFCNELANADCPPPSVCLPSPPPSSSARVDRVAACC